MQTSKTFKKEIVPPPDVWMVAYETTLWLTLQMHTENAHIVHSVAYILHILVLFLQYYRCYSVNTTSVPRCDARIKLYTKLCIRIRHPLLQMNRFFDSFWYSSSRNSSDTSPPPKPSLLFLFTLFPVGLLFLEVHNRVDKANISIFRRLR